MKNISNTTKHLTISFIGGFICLIAMQWVAIDIRVPMGWFVLMFWTAATIAWEYCQYWHYGRKLDYWKQRGWQTIKNMLALHAPFIALTMIAIYVKLW